MATPTKVPSMPFQNPYVNPATGQPRLPNEGVVPEGDTPPLQQSPGTLNFSMDPITAPIANVPLVGTAPINVPMPSQTLAPGPIVVPQTQPSQPQAIQPQTLAPEEPLAPPQVPRGPTFIPIENETTQTTNQTTTSGLTKESKQALQQASQAQIKAVQAQGDIAARKAAQEGLNKEELAAIQGQNISAEREAREAQKQKELEAQKALDQSAKDMLGFEFDQNRVWKRATTGQSIAAGIGIALGALAQGFGAKSNAAIDAIDKQVQRDIEQQRMEYEKIKDKTRAGESAYGRLRQMGLDDTQARQQLQNATLEQMKMKLEAGLAKQFGAEEAKAKTDAATADIQAKYAQETKATKNTTTGTTTTTQTEMKPFGANILSPDKRVELIQKADSDETIKRFKNSKLGLAKFKASLDPKTQRANPVALAEFVSGVTGLNQGSYDPKVFNTAMQSAGIVGRNAEALRDFWNNKKPVPKDITDNILQNLTNNVQQYEKPANRRFTTTYGPLGMDKIDVLGEDLDIGTAPKENF